MDLGSVDQTCWRALPTLHDGAAALPGGASSKLQASSLTGKRFDGIGL